LWAGASLVLAAWLVHLDRQGDADQDAMFAGGLRVSGVPVPEWDGDADLDVVYEHPSGQVIRASTYVWNAELLGSPNEPVDLEVSTTDPTRVRVAGDEFQPSNPLQYLLFAAPFVLGWGARRWSLAQSERLASSDAVSYQMRAVASSPGFWSWRWRIHLYALDSAPGALPICTAPLVEAPVTAVDQTVEVKGPPRPWGRVMIRDQGTGEVLWPSGRCLRTHGWGRRSLEPGHPTRPGRAGRVLAGLGVVLFAAGAVVDNRTQDSLDSGRRKYSIDATVVSLSPADDRGSDGSPTIVEVEWLGSTRAHRVSSSDAVVPGETIPVFIDPAMPDRVWAPGQDPPGGNVVGGIYAVGMLAVLSAAIVRVTARRAIRDEGHRATAAHVLGTAGQTTGAVSFPLRAYRFNWRKPTALVDAAAGSVELYLPAYFGRHRWRLDASELAVVDPASAGGGPVSSEVYFAAPPLVPYLFTTGPATMPTTGLLFQRAQRVPPIRMAASWAPNSNVPIGVRESRTSGGAHLDGVFLRFEDPAAAHGALLRAGATTTTDPDAWLARHRTLVVDPVEVAAVRRRHRRLVWLERSSYLFVALAALVALLVGEDASPLEFAVALAAIVASFAVRWAASALSRRDRARSTT
jgi:hypothetical protein